MVEIGERVGWENWKGEEPSDDRKLGGKRFGKTL